MSTLVLHPAAAQRRGSARTATRGRPDVRRRVVGRPVVGRPVADRPVDPHLAAVALPRVTDGPARLRLTRRGRVVVRLAVVLLGALATSAAVLAGGRVALADPQVRPVPVEWVVVQPGESLWQIAGRVAPEADRRDTVARIVELNALPSASLGAGRRIAVPAAP